MAKGRGKLLSTIQILAVDIITVTSAAAAANKVACGSFQKNTHNPAFLQPTRAELSLLVSLRAAEGLWVLNGAPSKAQLRSAR